MPDLAGQNTYKALARGVLAWAALSFGLNLLWEVAQLPLYRIPQDQGPLYAAYAVLHCTAGDVLIAVTSFLITVGVLRDPDWLSSQPWRGVMLVTFCGFTYTVLSEWRNVYQTGAWAYSSEMPLILGIGLAPMLQWLVVPPATLAILRFRARADRYRPSKQR